MGVCRFRRPQTLGGVTVQKSVSTYWEPRPLPAEDRIRFLELLFGPVADTEQVEAA